MGALRVSRNSRREERTNVRCRASARVAVVVEIIDASPSGVRARMSLPLPVGTVLKIGMPGGTERHARVAWSDDGVVGCEFMAPLDNGELARLVRAPAQVPASVN